jgi:hypothetical protein
MVSQSKNGIKIQCLFMHKGTMWETSRVTDHQGITTTTIICMGHAVAWLVKALCYQPEGRGFNSRWSHWILFNLSNPSSCTMATGSTQPLAEMSTRKLPWGKGRPGRKADNLTAVCEPIVWKMCEPLRLTTLWASTACYRVNFTFFLH